MRANLFLVKFDIAGLDHFGSFWYVICPSVVWVMNARDWTRPSSLASRHPGFFHWHLLHFLAVGGLCFLRDFLFRFSTQVWIILAWVSLYTFVCAGTESLDKSVRCTVCYVHVGPCCLLADVLNAHPQVACYISMRRFETIESLTRRTCLIQALWQDYPVFATHYVYTKP